MSDRFLGILGHQELELHLGSFMIEEGLPGSISFLANPLYTQYLYGTKASVVIITVFTSPTPLRAGMVEAG